MAGAAKTRLLRDALVWFFTGVGVLATLGAAALLLLYVLSGGFEDPFDETEVIAVIPSPSGAEAAVAYLHYFSNGSRTFIQVKRVRKPFPQIGASIGTRENVLTLVGDDFSDWWKGKMPDAGVRAAKLVEINWSGSTLLLCPAKDGLLVGFNDSYFEIENQLCLKRP